MVSRTLRTIIEVVGLRSGCAAIHREGHARHEQTHCHQHFAMLLARLIARRASYR